MKALVRNESVTSAIAVALALVFFALGLRGMREKSLTFDEPTFIGAGYRELVHQDSRLNPTHPPLMQRLEALPLLFLDLNESSAPASTWLRSVNPTIRYGQLLIFESGNDPRAIARCARLPVLLLGAALVLAVYFWGRRLLGAGPALLAAALTAVSPNLLAHAKVATADMGCTALMFMSVWTLWRGFEHDRVRDWIVCGMITGLALLSKFTALLLGPVYIVLAIVWGWGRGRAGLVRVARAYAILGGATLMVIAGAYDFDVLAYARRIGNIYSDHVTGYQYDLLGSVTDGPRWYYVLAAALVKVPVPTLLLIVLATDIVIRQPEQRRASRFLLVPAAMMFGVSFFDRANIGLRRVLPAFPFLMLFAGLAVRTAPRRWKSVVVLVLVAWTSINAVRIFPHHLAFFNALAGGPTRGPHLLDDSNIDWGQDLPALAAWQREHPEDVPIKLAYFGTAMPAAYGVRATRFSDEEFTNPRPGTYAMSAHVLAGLRKRKSRTGDDVDWLTRFKPEARAGYSIWIYRFR